MELYSEAYRTAPRDAQLDERLHAKVADVLMDEFGASVGAFSRLVFKYRAPLLDDVDVAKANAAVSKLGATVFFADDRAYVEVPKQFYRRWARAGRWITAAGVLMLLVTLGLIVQRLVERGRI